MQLKQGVQHYHQNNSGQQGDDQPTDEKTNQQEHNFQYYEQYRRLYQTAYLLSLQLKQLAKNKDDLWDKLGRLEKKTEDFKDDIRGEAPERKKRFRRTAQEIQRPFTCSVARCLKCYGSQGSLQQHIKLKHPELYESKSSQNRRQSGSGEAPDREEQFDQVQ